MTIAGGSTALISGCLGGENDDNSSNNSTSNGTGNEEAQLPESITIGMSSPALDAFAFPIWPTLENNLADQGTTLEADVFAGHSPTAGALIQEEILTGFMSLPSLIAAQNEGMPLIAIQGFMEQYEQPIVGAPGIDEFADLEGQRIAIHDPTGASAAIGFTMALEEWGDINAVEWEYIAGSGNRVAAMESGEVDATIVLLGAAQHMEESGAGNILAYPWDFERLTNAYMNLWVALEPQIDERAGELQGFVNEIQEAYNATYEGDITEIVQGVMDTGDYPDYSEDVWMNSLETLRENETWPTSKEEALSADRIETTQEMLVEVDLLDEEKTLSADELVTRQFLG